MKKKHYMLFIHIPNAPNPSVMMYVELRPIRNSNHKDYGKYSIYTESHYVPLNIADPIPLEDAVSIVEAAGCIEVKDTFDRYSIKDLREIKHLLSSDWIEGFNSNSKVDDCPEI